jgi:hypothetical protein
VSGVFVGGRGSQEDRCAYAYQDHLLEADEVETAEDCECGGFRRFGAEEVSK